ncbi:MAG: hypothetical protein HY921_03730 [Elusimicrobia bacterium]|nr:hypothetical protein [Elusimicrobiota bacterium]
MAFSLAAFGLVYGLYRGFLRLLAYLSAVPLIGPLIIWKLTAMALLMTFAMVAISSLLTSLTTLYYSRDLNFLMNAPVPLRAVFLDKSLESIFFSSWMIGVVLIPYVLALAKVSGYGAGFFAGFLVLCAPFLMLAASLGLAFTLFLLYCFPSSRTRDVVWVLSSLSLTVVYGLVRFSEPEKLVRPDALHRVAEYLNYLQAPTAPLLPSWWMTQGLLAAANGKSEAFALEATFLMAAAATIYLGLVYLAGRIYFIGYSGAQESARRAIPWPFEVLAESKCFRFLGLDESLVPLFWRERKVFFRDVKHWSQLLLILGLVFVYLFSIARLPLDSPDLRSLVSFLNVGTAGFVIAALGLRFTFPSISLEGRSWWVVRSAPVGLDALMRQKFLFSAVPMTAVALVLGLATNRLLSADAFTAWLSLASLIVITWGVCLMGIGFGALFPMFHVENIHQVESSLGGFLYMAASLFYIGAMILILSWPMQMHFHARFGRPEAWDWNVAFLSAAAAALLNLIVFIVPWKLGLKSLENHE